MDATPAAAAAVDARGWRQTAVTVQAGASSHALALARLCIIDGTLRTVRSMMTKTTQHEDLSIRPRVYISIV